jgi:hypothetical protein
LIEGEGIPSGELDASGVGVEGVLLVRCEGGLEAESATGVFLDFLVKDGF